MSWQRHELTIDEALADPMIAALMSADRVEPQVLRTFLRDSAASLASRRDAPEAIGGSALSWCCAIARTVAARESRAR